MPKYLVAILIVMICATVLIGCKKDGENDAKIDSTTETEVDVEEQVSDVQQATETVNDTEAPKGDGGGNKFIHDGEPVEVKTVDVLVSKNEYFYENTPITLEELVSMLEEVEDQLVVEIADNNATHKAYNKLIDKLTELEITFVEQ